MQRSVRVLAAWLGGFLAVSASCTDASRHPTGSARADRSIRSGAVNSQAHVAPVERTTALHADVTWSFPAGPEGAVSRNDEVGLTIVIPAGALASTETITVTALAGRHVAYRVVPHLEFGSAVRLVQDLSHIRPRSWVDLVGAHFAGDFLEVSNGVAAVTEQVQAIISSRNGTLHFDVHHFSGWIVGSGNEGPPDGSGSAGS